MENLIASKTLNSDVSFAKSLRPNTGKPTLAKAKVVYKRGKGPKTSKWIPLSEVLPRGIKFAQGNTQDEDLLQEGYLALWERMGTEGYTSDELVSAVASAVRAYRAMERRRGVTIGKGLLANGEKASMGYAKPQTDDDGKTVDPTANIAVEESMDELDQERVDDAISVIDALTHEERVFLLGQVEGTLPRSYRTTASKRLAKIRRKAKEVLFWKARVLARGDGDVTPTEG